VPFLELPPRLVPHATARPTGMDAVVEVLRDQHRELMDVYLLLLAPSREVWRLGKDVMADEAP
jgi:hypothetical protein